MGPVARGGARCKRRRANRISHPQPSCMRMHGHPPACSSLRWSAEPKWPAANSRSPVQRDAKRSCTRYGARINRTWGVVPSPDTRGAESRNATRTHFPAAATASGAPRAKSGQKSRFVILGSQAQNRVTRAYRCPGAAICACFRVGTSTSGRAERSWFAPAPTSGACARAHAALVPGSSLAHAVHVCRGPKIENRDFCLSGAKSRQKRLQVSWGSYLGLIARGGARCKLRGANAAATSCRRLHAAACTCMQLHAMQRRAPACSCLRW